MNIYNVLNIINISLLNQILGKFKENVFLKNPTSYLLSLKRYSTEERKFRNLTIVTSYSFNRSSSLTVQQLNSLIQYRYSLNCLLFTIEITSHINIYSTVEQWSNIKSLYE